jgi:hypothetical protein
MLVHPVIAVATPTVQAKRFMRGLPIKDAASPQRSNKPCIGIHPVTGTRAHLEDQNTRWREQGLIARRFRGPSPPVIRSSHRAVFDIPQPGPSHGAGLFVS